MTSLSMGFWPGLQHDVEEALNLTKVVAYCHNIHATIVLKALSCLAGQFCVSRDHDDVETTPLAQA